MAFSSSASTVANEDIQPFRLTDLPAELREHIYYLASAPHPPIDLASIASTPDHVQIPVVAQMSRETRREALAVFYRSRPIDISLNCYRNIERARAWFAATGAETQLGPTQITITGMGGKFPPGETYHIEIKLMVKEPFFRVDSRQGASEESNSMRLLIVDAVESRLEGLVALAGDWWRGSVRASDLEEIMDYIMKLTNADIFNKASQAAKWRRIMLGSNH